MALTPGHEELAANEIDGEYRRMAMTARRLRDLIAPIRPFDVLASCVALFCLAIAQPILDLLGRNPEFFLARSSPVSDVLLIGVTVGLLIPVALGLAVIGIRKANLMIGTTVHVVVIALLALVLLIEIVEQFLANSTVAISVGVIGSLAAVRLFYGSASIRSILRLMVLAPIAVLLSFVVISPTAGLIFAEPAIAGPTGIRVGDPAPIVMVVFDELPLASLIDGDGAIQEHNYPGFARLASDGYWFRNAVTSESSTERAIPSILTGRRATPEAIPVHSDYPENLFSLLAGIYEIDATEDLTDLCPDSACQDSEQIAWQQRWVGTAQDLRIVALHVLLPTAMTDGLPPIDQTWSDFGEVRSLDPGLGEGSETSGEFDLAERFHRELDSDRRPAFEGFLGGLGPSSGRPTFDFIHVLLPHSPWEYLPDGRRHGSPQPARGQDGPGWVDDSWLVDQIYQRHLLQVQYTDFLIGRMIDRLEDLAIYDEALIVVLADHGVAIAPGLEHRRRLSPESIGELAAVPLFVKPPGGVDGVIDDYRAETIDVLPTIADIVDVEIPWSAQGISLVRDDRPTRTETAIDSGELVIGVSGEEKLEVARRKIEIFGPGDPFDLAPSGTSDLLWKSHDQVVEEGVAPIRGEFSNLWLYQDIDFGAEMLPSFIQGILQRETTDPPVILAISVNGTISAVTRSYVREDQVLFQALIPPDRLASGHNEFRLLLVEGSGALRRLTLVPTE